MCLDRVLKKIMDPDPVCLERLDPDCYEMLDPDPVYVRIRNSGYT